jgi:hypothetical protein
MLIILFLR